MTASTSFKISANPVTDAGTDPEPQAFTIGQLCEEFGLTPRAIRFYEDEGLLSPERQGQSRIYAYRDRARLSLICRGKRLGFSLRDIREFLDLYAADGLHVEQMRYLKRKAKDRIALLRQQLIDVEQTLKELADIEAQIDHHLEESTETNA